MTLRRAGAVQLMQSKGMSGMHRDICRTWVCSTEKARWRKIRPSAPGRTGASLSPTAVRGQKWLGMGGAFAAMLPARSFNTFVVRG